MDNSKIIVGVGRFWFQLNCFRVILNGSSVLLTLGVCISAILKIGGGIWLQADGLFVVGNRLYKIFL
jgi:hypothetical protein